MADVNVDKELWLKIIKKVTKEGQKYGYKNIDIPDNVASGLADQYGVAYDLIKSGKKLSPDKLALALGEKAIGIARMGSSDERYQCGVAVALLGTAFFKAYRSAAQALLTEGALTPLFVFDAIEAVQKLYEADQKCGVSKAVTDEVYRQAEPAYMWFEKGVIDFLNSNAMPRL